VVSTVSSPRAPGERVDLRIPIETIEHATGQLLRLAPEVEVIGPAALRRSTIERLQRIGALYGIGSSPHPRGR
jgi:hypothetical protein